MNYEIADEVITAVRYERNDKGRPIEFREPVTGTEATIAALVALVSGLQETIADLTKEVGELSSKLDAAISSNGLTMPSYYGD
jgi:hypothetical protein